jgi:3-oxoacyl-[acyl-carrier protein] reductase
MIDTGLEGKVVLVTGANHGIGAATARAFAAEGAAVFVQYLSLPVEDDASTSEQRKPDAPGEALYRAQRAMPADTVVQAIRGEGGQAEVWEADLADPSTVPRLFERAEAAFGSVDVLVNNAAHWEPDSFLPPQVGTFDPFDHPLPTITPESHDRHFAVNSRALALMTAEYARRRIEQGAGWGRVINVSTDGAAGFRGQVSYGASKYALESLSRAAAGELAAHGITVNVVSPGPIQTGYISADLEQRLLSEIPLGRLGEPEDVADVIVFLASEQARWLTGQVLYVGGGHRTQL